jgi:dolichol-phosphate mannosyltransferase
MFPFKPNVMSALRARRWIAAGTAWQYSKFCLVGASGVVVDMLVLHILVSPAWLHWNLTVSKLLSAETAMLSNFLLNDVWTFHEPSLSGNGRSSRFARLWKYHLVCAGGILISVALVRFQVERLGWGVTVANLQAIGVVSFWNYFLSRRFGWASSG